MPLPSLQGQKACIQQKEPAGLCFLDCMFVQIHCIGFDLHFLGLHVIRFSALVLDCIFAKLIHVFSQGDDGLGDDVEVELPAPMPVGRVGGGSVLWQIFIFLIFHWSVD